MERAHPLSFGTPALTWRTPALTRRAPALGAHALARRRCGGGRGRVVWGAADAGSRLRRPPRHHGRHAASGTLCRRRLAYAGCIWSWAPVAGVSAGVAGDALSGEPMPAAYAVAAARPLSSGRGPGRPSRPRELRRSVRAAAFVAEPRIDPATWIDL